MLFHWWVEKFWPEKLKDIFCFCILSKFICFWCTENVCALSITYSQNFQLHVHVYLPVFVKIKNKEIACIHLILWYIFLHNLEFIIIHRYLFTNENLQNKRVILMIDKL